MKKTIVFILALLLPIWPAFSMSTPEKVSHLPRSDGNDTVLIKSAVHAVQEICDGNFAAAEQTIKESDVNDSSTSAILGIISEYNEIQKTMQEEREKAFQEQISELEKLKARPETNEPNLLDIFPVILKAREYAVQDRKTEVLAEPFVKATIARAQKAAADYESKGEWIDALLNCYSWLAVLYEDDKTYKDKKDQLEEKAIIKASLTDSPCETSTDRYEKIKPDMFIRALDVLGYSYVEPFHYGDMTEKAFERCRYLAEVISLSENFDPNTFKIQFEKDQIPQFVAGLSALEKNYRAESLGISKDQFIKLFNHVLALNSATMKLPEQVVISHFAEASLSALDPHTMIIWPKQVEDFEKNMTNEFTGIGVEISKQDGPLKAVSLVPGTPAYNSGLLDAGDIIEAVNGESTKDMSISCAVSKITGPAGTKVVLTIRRQQEEKTRDIEITRARIIVPTTRGWCRDDSGNWLYFVDDKDKIGYVRVTQFSGATAADLDEIITKLEAEGMKGLVLDLRFNSGGYLQSAADITDLFVEKGVMVSTQPRVGLPTWETAEKKGTHPNYPLVILINSSSASASEIVSGALADKTFSRATLVGEQSYGKGSVQTITPYPGDGAQMKYTMAYYHLPSGQRVNDRWAMEKLGKKNWGVSPNVKVKLVNEEIKKVLDIQRDNDVLAAADHDQNKAKLKRHNLTETLQADRQLDIAILVAKAKLIESGPQQ